MRPPREQPAEAEYEEREESAAERPGASAKASEAREEETGAQARKGPRRRGRRGGRRGRSGQRPPLTPGEESVRAELHPDDEARPRAEAEASQNGARSKPHIEEASETRDAEQPRSDARLFETVTAEQPAGEPRVEPRSEPEAPRRKGWWQR
jgi:hypothetical protein